MQTVRKVNLEGTGGYIKVTSCLAKEFPKVKQLAIAFLDVSDEDALAAVAEEIVGTFCKDLDPGKLTLNDLWEILLAKAGEVQGALLRRLPEIAAQKMVDFLASQEFSKQVLQAVEAEISTSVESGENTSPA